MALRNLPDVGPCPQLSRRDLGSVLSSIGSGAVAPAPLIPRPWPPMVIDLRPGIFHGRGLFPCGVSVPRFICPSVFSATGWCRRALLPSELLLVFDVPPIVGAHFSSPGAVSDLLHDIRAPNKVLVQMARAL